MICFLCAFARGRYCYCASGMPVRVASTDDMRVIEIGQEDEIESPLTLASIDHLYRSKSEPCLFLAPRQEFIRYRSLRETKKEKSARREEMQERRGDNNAYGKSNGGFPIRVDVVSIQSGEHSTDYSFENEDEKEIALEAVPMPMSSGLLILKDTTFIIAHSPVNSSFMMSEDDVKINALHYDEIRRFSSEHLNGLKIEVLSDDENGQNNGVNNDVDVNGDVDMPFDYGSSIDHQQYYSYSNQHSNNHSNEVTPSGYSPISYHVFNPFADPLEDMEEERRSRTELWVEQTSPGMPDEEEAEEGEFALEAVNEDDMCRESKSFEKENTHEKYGGIPEVRIDACSEPSVNSPNQLENKPDREDESTEKKVSEIRILESGDSLQTEELKSDHSEVSFVSSTMDKQSLVRAKFTNNLDKARECQWSEVDLNNIERFWEYRYHHDDDGLLPEAARKLSSTGSEENGEEEYGEECERRRRGPTPTLERVVMYYVGDRSVTEMRNSKRKTTKRMMGELKKENRIEEISTAVEKTIILPTEERPIQEIQPPTITIEEKAITPEESQKHVTTILVNERKESVESASILIGNISDISIEDEEDDTAASESTKFFHLVKMGSNEEEIVEQTIQTIENGNSDMRPPSPYVSRSSSRNRAERNPSLAVTPSPQFSPNIDTLTSSPSADVISAASSSHIISQHGLSVSPSHSVRRVSSVRSPSSEAGLNRREDYVAQREITPSLYKEKRDKMQSSRTASPHHLRPSTSTTNSRTNSRSSSSKATQCDMIVTPRSSHTTLSSAISSPSLNTVGQNRVVSFNEALNSEISSPKCTRRYNPKAGYRSILKRDNTQKQMMRKLMEEVEDKLFNELRLLVEERDRANHGIEFMCHCPEDTYLSPETAYYQTRYRRKLEENKHILDKQIDEAWKRLRELGVGGIRANFIYNVTDSKQLTLNAKRRGLPRRHTVFIDIDKKEKSGIELASIYAHRLEKLRAGLGREDSFTKVSKDEEESSILKLVDRVSKALSATSPTISTGSISPSYDQH